MLLALGWYLDWTFDEFQFRLLTKKNPHIEFSFPKLISFTGMEKRWWISVPNVGKGGIGNYISWWWKDCTYDSYKCPIRNPRLLSWPIILSITWIRIGLTVSLYLYNVQSDRLCNCPIYIEWYRRLPRAIISPFHCNLHLIIIKREFKMFQ